MIYRALVSGGVAEAYNRQFPDRKCFAGIMLPTGIIGISLSTSFTVIAFFMAGLSM
jgi:hypothetical protein